MERKQNHPTCKEHTIAKGLELASRLGFAGHRKCWFGNKQYVFTAYRHDLAGDWVELFTQKCIKKKKKKRFK